MADSVKQEVENLITAIVAKNGFNKDAKIIYNDGSQTGDGFLSKSLAITISDEQKALELFVKIGLNLTSSNIMPTERYYVNEMHFYDNISPAITEFLEEKKITDGFTNVAKCYGTSKMNIIVLENLRKKGYKLCDKTKPLNDDYISLVFKTFAKLHAASYALKDQKPELYQKLIASTLRITEDISNPAWEQAWQANVNKFLTASFDPVKDKHILNRTQNLAKELSNWGNKKFYNPAKTEYDIIIQGDCWCNNMMFMYEEANKEKPKDVVLLDWHIIRVTWPVFDLAYFFYTGASEEGMRNIDKYLELYYEVFSQQLKNLGSDPDVLYPHAVFKQQWKECAKFGLFMCFMLIKVMLCEADEYPDFESIDFNNIDDTKRFFQDIKNNDEYYRRLKVIVEHLVEKDYI